MQQPIERRTFIQAALALAASLTAVHARAAQGRVLFPFVLNPSIVPMATALLKEMESLYQPNLGEKMESVPGNFGGVAMEALHKANADGSTVMLAPSSMLTLLTHLRKLKVVNQVEDLVPVAPISEFTCAFAVGPAVPAAVNAMTDFLQWARDNPSLAHYGVPGLGSAPHFVGMALARKADLSLKPVAYTGTQSATDVKNGALPAALLPLTVARYSAREAGVRLLAVASQHRWQGLPDVPTMLELGLADVAVVESFGMYVSARTPLARRQELGSAVQQAAAMPAVRAAMAQASMLPSSIAAADYAASLAQERARWGEIVGKYRFSLES